MEVLKVLGIESEIERKTKIYIFVIGRNASHFSGVPQNDERAVWGIWPQIIRLIVQRTNYDDPIEWLYHEIKKDSPENKNIEKEGFDLKINNFTIFVRKD